MVEADAGVYTCRFENQEDSVDADAVVTVSGTSGNTEDIYQKLETRLKRMLQHWWCPAVQPRSGGEEAMHPCTKAVVEPRLSFSLKRAAS